MKYNYKYITDEAIANHKIALSSDNSEAWKELRNYNEHMSWCRIKRTNLKDIRNAYLGLNILVIFVLELCYHFFVSKTILSIIIIPLYLIELYYLPFKNRDFRILQNTVASSILIIVNIRFAVLLLFNIVVCYLYNSINNVLKEEDGYPDFFDISCINDDTVHKVK